MGGGHGRQEGTPPQGGGAATTNTSTTGKNTTKTITTSTYSTCYRCCCCVVGIWVTEDRVGVEALSLEQQTHTALTHHLLHLGRHFEKTRGGTIQKLGDNKKMMVMRMKQQ